MNIYIYIYIYIYVCVSLFSVANPLSSEYGAYKTVKTRLCLRFSDEIPKTFQVAPSSPRSGKRNRSAHKVETHYVGGVKPYRGTSPIRKRPPR